MKSLRTLVIAAVLVSSTAVTGCGGDAGGGTNGDTTALPQGSESVELDSAEFSVEIDNPHFPLSPGARWVYRETDGEGRIQLVVVTVTDRTRTIANGITARIVRDVVSAEGQVVEATEDWYAQDSDGNVWYLGEQTAEYEDGKLVSRSGSFEAGVDGAQAGIIMPADPEPGQAYRQEYYAGEAEDKATVLGLGERVRVPFGRFANALETEDVNPLDHPPAIERKYYVKGIGLVLARQVSPDVGREELVSFRPGA